MFQLLSSVYAAGKQLARRRPGRRRGRPNPASRDHHRRCHDFDHGEVVGPRPEAALRPPFPAGEAAGHDPAVLEPDAVQRPRHRLGDVVVPAGPYHTPSPERSLPCSSNLEGTRSSRKNGDGWVHRRVHDDDVGALADPLEVGDLQSRDLRLGFLRVAHHALELARKLLQPESTTRLLVVTVRIAMKRALCILTAE